MKYFIVFLALFLCAPILFAADLSGIWLYSSKAPDGHSDREVLVLQQTGAQLTGKMERPWGTFNIQKGTVDGNHFTLTATTDDGYAITSDGTLEGNKLHVTVREPNQQPRELIAERTKTDPFTVTNVIPPPALHDVPYNGLAKTPPMGWNSWNKFAGQIDDKAVREIADAMVVQRHARRRIQLRQHRRHLGGPRDANGNITSNNKFPDMKALADYVHSKGLKIGIYSAPGPLTCAGYRGQLQARSAGRQDVGGVGIRLPEIRLVQRDAMSTSPDAMQAAYQKMGDALRATGRPIVYSLCQYGLLTSGSGAPQGGRQPVAHHRRHPRQLERMMGIARSAGGPREVRRARALERSRHARDRQRRHDRRRIPHAHESVGHAGRPAAGRQRSAQHDR